MLLFCLRVIAELDYARVMIPVLHVLEPVLIAKSSILLDVKPWDDETDMKAMEEKVRTIVADGLVWGACKCHLCLQWPGLV